MGCITSFYGKHKEYINVFLAGCLSVAVISSVFSYLTNVNTILVMPDNAYYDNMVNGILCRHDGDDTNHCNTITNIMANNTNDYFTIDWEELWEAADLNISIPTTTSLDYSEWQCSSITDLSNREIYWLFTSFKAYLFVLITFTVIFATFAIIHDFTLIHHKNNLNAVTFHPAGKRDFYFGGKVVEFYEQSKCWKRKINLNDCPCFIKYLVKIPWYLFELILVTLGLAVLLIDAFIMTVVYPIFSILGTLIHKM